MLLLASSVACAVGSDNENTFGFTGGGPGGPTGDSGGSSESGETGSSGSSETTDGVSMTSSSTTDPSTVTTDPSTVTTDPSTATTNMTTTTNGGQPADGMYSDCLVAADCPGLAGCATIGMPADDGFCTAVCTGYMNPANCDPSPGGTSTPTCIVLSGMNLCALDCSAGKTCPAGMICTLVADEEGDKEICY